MEVLFIGIILLILGLTNLIAFKVAGRNKKRRIISGVIVILITPLIFKISLDVIGSFDPGGFATGAITLIYSTLFFINGIIIILIGITTNSAKKA
ncbi:hypothetical protein M1K46_24185 [Fictibacillus sp. WQ 8-8]|uniref:hypothetical protein n=1 Tax=Fictibacillus sp. WQ 8-8 TaxID=2938788 RepID=UPI00210CC7AA|nr:hypothetical protein [Fictibacillus sp. WQ 8-8]MCQ6268677.1 hypothetical protein [Fictibacillus sp. WQ 8-8]